MQKRISPQNASLYLYILPAIKHAFDKGTFKLTILFLPLKWTNLVPSMSAEKKLIMMLLCIAYRESIWTAANSCPSVIAENSDLWNLQRKLPLLLQANRLQSSSTTIHQRI